MGGPKLVRVKRGYLKADDRRLLVRRCHPYPSRRKRETIAILVSLRSRRHATKNVWQSFPTPADCLAKNDVGMHPVKTLKSAERQCHSAGLSGSSDARAKMVFHRRVRAKMARAIRQRSTDRIVLPEFSALLQPTADPPWWLR